VSEQDDLSDFRNTAQKKKKTCECCGTNPGECEVWGHALCYEQCAPKLGQSFPDYTRVPDGIVAADYFSAFTADWLKGQRRKVQ
jgi:hypothetical protein